jgi:hypothetical protein
MKDMQQGDRRPTMAVDMLIGTIITIHTVRLGRTIATSIMSMEKDMDTVTMEKRDITWSMPDLTSTTTMLHLMTTVTTTSSSQQETSSSPPRASTCRLLPSQTRISKRSTLHTPHPSQVMNTTTTSTHTTVSIAMTATGTTVDPMVASTHTTPMEIAITALTTTTKSYMVSLEALTTRQPTSTTRWALLITKTTEMDTTRDSIPTMILTTRSSMTTRL